MPSQSIWGPATWLLFHTLAEKIHEDKFNDIEVSNNYTKGRSINDFSVKILNSI